MRVIVLILFFLFPVPVFACSQDSFGPCLYAPDGTYLGNLNRDQFDPNSTSNPLGPHGSPLGPDSIHNPLSPYWSVLSPMSPNFGKNPYSQDPAQRPDWENASGSRYSAPLGSGGGWGALGFALGQASARREAARQEQEEILEQEAAAELQY